ncbi:MAG: CoA transferase [Silicimonas sp.]|nr:CoA transferase [Silicimonas sp.]
MPKPLHGIRVLDLTNVLAGPFCCHHLAHLGAEVIKVEAVGRGDLARQLGADPDLSERHMGVSFLAQNAGKKSVTLNLKHPKGKALFLRLVDTADVLVENFRPGVMARLGLDHESLRDAHPRLIYCAISGFGQDGPWVHRPAYDQIIQGASGAMSITGDKDTAPLRAGYPVADTVGGLTAAFAIAAALNANPRGTFIDISMLESTLATMGWVVSNYLVAGVEPSANGNENVTSAPSGTFDTADTPINIAANKNEQWVLLANHLNLGHLCDHPDYKTREDRKRNRLALKRDLEAVLKHRPARDWETELTAIGVPAGAVLSVPAILETPQVRDRGFLTTFADVPGVDRDVQLATTGIKLDAKAPGVDTPPPRLGEHNAEIWTSLGVSEADLKTLKQDGVI